MRTVTTGHPCKEQALARRGASWLSSDTGLSLAELMIVVFLLGFVLAAAYALQTVATNAANINEPIATGSQALSDPMEYMSRIIMQSRSVATSGAVTAPNGAKVTIPGSVQYQPDAYGMAVATDRVPFNGEWELNYFHISAADPTVLAWDSWQYSDVNNVVATTTAHWTMSRVANNRSVGLPLFTYYGTNNTVLTTPLDISADLRIVGISLAVPTPNSGWSQDRRIVTLRN